MANSYGWTSPTTVKSPDQPQDSKIHASLTTGKSSHATHPTSPYVTVNGAPRQHGDALGSAALGLAPSQFFTKN